MTIAGTGFFGVLVSFGATVRHSRDGPILALERAWSAVSLGRSPGRWAI